MSERTVRGARSADAAASGVLTPLQRVGLFLSRIWAWAFLGLMVLFFVVAVPLTSGGAVNFLTVRNSQNILVAIVPVLLLGLGQTFVIITAGIDLSVGWVMSLASVLSALAIRDSFNAGVPLFPAVVIGLVAAVAGAAFVGGVNGVIIAKLKVPAFIVTLGTSFIVRGVAYLMSENTTVIGLPADIRAYGNDALDLSGRRSGRRDLFPGAAGIESRPAAPHGRDPPLSGRHDRLRRRLGDVPAAHAPASAATPTPSAATWTRRSAPASRSTGISSSSTCCRPRPRASRASCRRCATPRAPR